MIHLNYNDLSQEAQERLLIKSKTDVQNQFGEDLKRYSNKNGIALETLLEEEAIRNLYCYKYSFRL
ncbi:hypothetical protein [Arenibacter lacus]|uniref:hypothetical protein n=1 Tax=Arenibacter lacus TaxID=2608629 RepID=UPI00123D69A4|nr:hypothetical protein [Arenibacter lacus]